MSKANIKRVKYFTEDKLKLINPDSMAKYEKYLRSNIIKNREVEETTFKVYRNNFQQFLVYLAEEWDNVDLYSEDFIENAVDIMEGFIAFCQDTLQNNKKAINNKLAAVSTFYHWSVKRKYIQYHPFDKRLDRMKYASEEHIINSYFLTDENVEKIREGLKDETQFDLMDKVLWEIMLDSANRIGAIEKLKLTEMDLDACVFKNVREKRGYRVEVAFSEETRDLIEQWLDYRKENMDELKVDALFISKYGKTYKQMSKSALQDRIRKIGSIIGLEDFHAHCIRKTTLNSIYEKTGDLALSAEMGNHKSTETTRSSYIKPKSKAEVRDKIKELMKKNSEKNED